jgi:trimeric autotransporter adhesin
MRKWTLKPWVVLSALVALSACGRDKPITNGGEREKIQIAILPERVELHQGQAIGLEVVRYTQTGTVSLLGDPALQLLSSAPEIATVTSTSGVVIGHTAGTSSISAQFKGASAQSIVVVDSQKLVSLKVEPAILTLRVQETRNLVVTAGVDDGSSLDVTQDEATSYSVTNSAVVEVNSQGEVTGLTQGQTDITIVHGALTAQASVTVTDVAIEFESISLEPDSAGLKFGESLDLIAYGHLSDGSKVDLLGLGLAVIFQSSAPSIAGVTSSGRVTAATASSGTATIIAQYDGHSAFSEISVTPPEASLIGISVQPSTVQLGIGGSQQLLVLGIYSDGSTADLSSGISGTTYFSENPRFVSVDSDGLLRGVDSSNSTIVRVSHGAFTAEVNVIVAQEVRLLALTVAPNSIRIDVGDFVALSVFAIYSDGTQVDVTNSAQYTPTTPGIVSVSNTGIVLGLAAGETLIRIEFDGQQATVSARVESDAPTVVALTIQPALITAGTDAASVSRPFIVEAIYSDGTQVDVTFSANLSLSVANPAIAQIVAGNQIQGIRPGTTELVASFSGIESRVPIIISNTTNNILFIFITGPSAMVIGQLEPYAVLAALSDGSFQDVTSSAQIVLSPPGTNVVDIQPGMVRAINAGMATLNATYQGFTSADHDINVTTTVDPLIGIAFVPTQLNLQVGQSEIVNVVATYQSGAQVTITFDPNINSQWSGPIQVLPDIAGGRVLATGPGSAQITVTYMGFSTTLPITISNSMPSIVSIEIQVASTVETGQTIPFAVRGIRSDGSSVDLSLDPMLTVTTAPSGAVSISGVQLQGLQAGVAGIEASYGMLSDGVRITVVDSPVVQIFWVPRILSLDIGQTTSAALRARRANGQEFEISTEPSVNLLVTGGIQATQTANGIEISAQSAGPANVQARYQNLQADLPVTVNAPTLTQISGQPNPIQLDIGDSQAITVIGTYSDGSQQTLSGASFNILTPSIASVDANGLVRALSSGSTIIFVDYMGVGTIVSVQVASPQLLSISVTPSPLNVQTGATGQLSVFGNFSDGSQQAISGASFTSGDVQIATVNNNGLVSGISAGTIGITVNFGGFSTRAIVVVSDIPVTLVGITIQPAMVTLNVGDTQQYSVTAVYSDGTQQMVTGASFSVSTPAIASITNSGLATGLAAGTTRVVADYQGETAFAVLTVQIINAVLVGIRLEPSVIMLSPGGTQQVTIIGIFSDGSEQPQSGGSFSSSDTAIASINSQGLITAGSNAGTAIITAQLMNFVASSVVIVTGTQVTLIGIRVEPSSLSIDVGQSSRLQVIGSYSDGTEQTLSGATFQSANTGVASVNTSGDVLGISPGQTQVTASISGFSASSAITVNVPGLVLFSIRFDPSSLVLQVGDTANVTIIGTYSDGSEAPVTPDQLSSDDQGVATITSGGQVDAVAEGSTTIRAIKGSLSAQANVTVLSVSAPTITSISPSAIAVGTSFAMLTIRGTGFVNASRVIINGQAVPAVFQSSTSLSALVPANLVQSPGTLDVLVRNPAGQGGDSNVVEVLVGNPPTITNYAPNAALSNSSVIVTVRGTNLVSLSASASAVNVVNIVEDGTGTQVELTIVIPNIMAGIEVVTLSNPFGSVDFDLEVLPNSGNPDLEVANGETLMLSGVNVYNNILIQTGGTIIGSGREPLVLYATGNITVRGHISVDGQNGEDGFSDPANGGEGGPGAGGGGGAGDGNANPVAVGGDGSPAGQSAGNSSGAGTTAGNGGGVGAGQGGSGGCGQGGGGGGLIGGGGSAGGDQGVGTGGAGGPPGTGSDYGAGTGGGGGSTCGGNSGGGGGGGGGILILEVAQGGTLIVDGTLSANGGHAGNAFFGTGGGGGGSGGRIEITAPSGSIVINDTISVRGGNGGQADFGDGGGGGGGGTVIVNALPLGTITANLGLFDLAGGSPGPSLGNGFSGQAGDQGSVSITP